MSDAGVDWNEVYKNAKSITDVPWETVEPAEELLKAVKEGKINPCKALDIGCGFGTQSIFLAKNGFSVKAFDISEKAIETAKKRALDAGVKVDFFVGDATNMKLSEEFDFILDRGCFHALDKKDRIAYIKNVHLLLDAEGKYYLEVFSENNPPPGPGPFMFTKKEIADCFSHYFNILQIKEFTHFEINKKDKKNLYSVLMKKIQPYISV